MQSPLGASDRRWRRLHPRDAFEREEKRGLLDAKGEFISATHLHLLRFRGIRVEPLAHDWTIGQLASRRNHRVDIGVGVFALAAEIAVDMAGEINQIGLSL